MKMLDKIFTEEDVEKVSEKILKKTSEKIKTMIADEFYQENSAFLYDHYHYLSNGIKDELIKEISDEFIKDPSNYLYCGLRKKIFEENKELITNTIVEEGIKNDIENIILKYTYRSNYFNWQYKDGIIQFIFNNWAELEKDVRINNGLLSQIDNLKSRILWLEEELNNKNYTE